MTYNERNAIASPERLARGTVPLAVIGPENYGYRLGLLGAPSRVAMAAARLLFGLLIDWYGVGVLVVSRAGWASW